MEIKRREFIKLAGLMGIGTIVPFNTQESSPYNVWKPLGPSRLQKAESICPLCSAFCKIEVLKKRENIFSITPKEKRGLCPKIFTYHNIIYNEKRIKSPLLRRGDRGKDNLSPIDYDKALEILKEKLKADRFYADAFAPGEADRYYLNAISKKINFYPDAALKAAVGADKVYFHIEKADLILNFGGDILSYANFLDAANYLSGSAKKVISFGPMVTKGTALGEEWYPISIENIPHLSSAIINALGKNPSFNIEQLEKRTGVNKNEFLKVLSRIKDSNRICIAFDPYLSETEEGIRALNSIIDLAKSLKSINSEGGTYFYNSLVSSKPFNFLSENISNYLVYNLDPFLTNYSLDFEEKLKQIPFIVYIGSHHSEITKYADLILPSSFFVEKDEAYLKRDKGGFSVLFSSPAIEGGVEAVELRKKENIEIIFQKLLNFKAPYGIKDISDISRELEPKLLDRRSYLSSLSKGIKITQVNPTTEKAQTSSSEGTLSLYLYEDGILSFINRGSKWAEESSHLNRALINKKTAKKLGVKSGEKIEIKTEKGEVRIKVLIYEGIADDTVGLKRYKIPIDINHYSNKKIKLKTNDKEIENIWWEDENVDLKRICKGKSSGYNFSVCDVKIISLKKV